MKLTTWAVAIVCAVSAAATTAACTAAPGSFAGATAKSGDSNGSGASTDGNASQPQTESNQQTTDTSGLPCDVDAVLKADCQTCHSSPPQYGASTSLVTYDDLMKDAPAAYPGKKVWQVVQARIHDTTRPMPAAPATPLQGADLASMDNWFTANTPKSSASCTSNAPADGVKPLSCTPDVTFKGASPFTMAANAPLDTYMCYGVDVTLTKKRHIIGLAPNIDNHKIVHHILLFQADDSQPSTPFQCSAFGSASWRLVAGWAPGGNNLELPAEAGYPEEVGTTHWVMQIHYNNASNATGAQDSSGYSMCTTEDLRANDAAVLAFGSTNFSIPPRSTSTVSCDYSLDDRFDGVHLFNASPHMHTHGTALKTTRLAGGQGDELPIFDQEDFSFEAQGNYKLDDTLASGDTMRTRCTWKNPGDTTISFGENTEDEMCFDFIGYYPAIPDKTFLGVPLFTWITPSAEADCSMSSQ